MPKNPLHGEPSREGEKPGKSTQYALDLVGRHWQQFQAHPRRKFTYLVSRVNVPQAHAAVDVLNIIAYPRPEHVAAFHSAAQGVQTMSPAEDFPGAVASLRAWLTHRQAPTADVRFAQRHYRLKTRGRTVEHPLPATLHKEYKDWLPGALDLLFSFAQEQKAEVRLRSANFRKRGPDGKPFDPPKWRLNDAKELLRAARRAGFKRLADNDGAYFVPAEE